MSKRHKLVITNEEWLQQVAQLRGPENLAIIEKAIASYSDKTSPELKKGLGIADILLTLGLDNEALAAAFIYPALQNHQMTSDTVLEQFGEGIRKLLQDALQMQLLGKLSEKDLHGGPQTEKWRKMLLAMVTDVRAVLIIIAERLWKLREAKTIAQDAQIKIANESLAVYAPLANRLGVWQLKWEIEDLSLRYLQPEIYMQIAKGLASRREERELHLQQVKTMLIDLLNAAAMQNVEVTGRVKHIYSIYNKMVRKNANIEDIYDISALRVLVDKIDDCYHVLSILQNTWSQVHHEFDDYIANPKPNGYRSIHTVIVGPDQKNIEIQIRTYQMHQESELGVAAHWRYKEGVLQTSDYETKIALLRQVMAWQKEVIHSDDAGSKQATPDLFSDRVYVFTPTGDIVDLAKGATPLDFAYHIHSEVGHRCRGAKINNKMVPLSYELKTGERIEILTAKQAAPSRDWLNPHLGYIKTQRARAKIQHWFKLHDSKQNAIDGRELLERELKRLGITGKIDLDAVAEKLHHKNNEELLISLAEGHVRIAQIIHCLQPSEPKPLPLATDKRHPDHEATSDVQIYGINNLLTHIALCCKPLPGDSVIGYVTRNRGITVHRRDCPTISHETKDERRFIEVAWGGKQTTTYTADLMLRILEQPGLLRDITTLLASEKINVLTLQTQKIQDSSECNVFLTIEVSNRLELKTAFELLQRLPHLIELHRR